MGHVFQADPSIAADWLVARSGDTARGLLWRSRRVVEDAIKCLRPEDRLHVVSALASGFDDWDITRGVVSHDLAAYQALLERADLRDVHLAPLSDMPTGSWVKLALAALDRGYLPEAIVEVARSDGHGWVGEVSDMLAGWIEAYDRLIKDPDPRLREIGRLGADRDRRQQAEARVKERRRRIGDRD